jgi:hypothetical protein
VCSISKSDLMIWMGPKNAAFENHGMPVGIEPTLGQ